MIVQHVMLTIKRSMQSLHNLFYILNITIVDGNWNDVKNASHYYLKSKLNIIIEKIFQTIDLMTELWFQKNVNTFSQFPNYTLLSAQLVRPYALQVEGLGVQIPAETHLSRKNR